MKKIQVLGTGCPKCQQLASAVEAAARAAGCEFTLEKVTRPAEFAKFGVMLTPALVVDGKVVSAGRVPPASEIEPFLREGSARAGSTGLG